MGRERNHMRIFNIPKIEKKQPTLEIEESMDFVNSIVQNNKKVHFNTTTTISSPVLDLKGYRLRPNQTEEEVLKRMKKPTSAVSWFVKSLHNAFAEHIPFSISPEVIMMIISQEIAQYVKTNSEDISVASLFTKTPGEKKKLIVEANDFVLGQQNDWLGVISKFKELLQDNVPSNTLKHMVPKFSNSTLETETAHTVSFMDATSKFYTYETMTCCGIPEFKIEGEPTDWDEITKSVGALNVLLPGLSTYFTKLISVITEIRNTVDGNKVNTDFWDSIYKQGSGSGGPYSNGWFNDLYAHQYGIDWRTGTPIAELKVANRHYMTKITDFPSNISCVPFNWSYYGSDIPMSFVAGITNVEVHDGFLTPKLGIAVLENEKKEV